MEILEYCTKAEIFDNDGKVLCEAMVSIGPMGSLLLTVPRSLDYLNQEIFRILFYDPTLGRLTCRCALSSPLLAGLPPILPTPLPAGMLSAAIRAGDRHQVRPPSGGAAGRISVDPGVPPALAAAVQVRGAHPLERVQSNPDPAGAAKDICGSVYAGRSRHAPGKGGRDHSGQADPLRGICRNAAPAVRLGAHGG